MSDLFSPSFVELIDSNGALTTIDVPPGHVVVAFVNNVSVDEKLLAYLESTAGGALVLTDVEKLSLRPRMRFRVQITYGNGQTLEIEFVDGSATLVQPGFDAEAEPDLNQNSLNNAVVLCQVNRVEVLDPIEVFIPLEWTFFEFVEPTDQTVGFFREQAVAGPRFFTLQVDDVDEDLNTLVRRNIGIRDQPSPVNQPLCGSVVTIVVDGTLSVPFFSNVPGFPNDDINSQGRLGGTYRFSVSIQ